MENSRIPNRLKKYRRLFCFSQKDVAAMLGLKEPSPLSRWEKGISIPSLTQLFRLARIYKTIPNELYYDLWQTVSKEVVAIENNLLAQDESISTNEVYQL